MEKIRAYCELIEATTILELAIWKAKLDQQYVEDIKEARQVCRTNCGAEMNIIMKGVLSFFSYTP